MLLLVWKLVISGAVGNFVYPPFVEKYVCDKLDIHYPRNLDTGPSSLTLHAVRVLASIATSIGSGWQLKSVVFQKSEQREVEEFFARSKGSSAMPHKRNPIGSENMAGLARVIPWSHGATYESSWLRTGYLSFISWAHHCTKPSWLTTCSTVSETSLRTTVLKTWFATWTLHLVWSSANVPCWLWWKRDDTWASDLVQPKTAIMGQPSRLQTFLKQIQK